MVEAGEERFNGARQLSEVPDPAGVLADRSGHVHRHPVGVPVQPAHLWPGGTWGSRWAASKVNSLKISTSSVSSVSLG